MFVCSLNYGIGSLFDDTGTLVGLCTQNPPVIRVQLMDPAKSKRNKVKTHVLLIERTNSKPNRPSIQILVHSDRHNSFSNHMQYVRWLGKDMQKILFFIFPTFHFPDFFQLKKIVVVFFHFPDFSRKVSFMKTEVKISFLKTDFSLPFSRLFTSVFMKLTFREKSGKRK